MMSDNVLIAIVAAAPGIIASFLSFFNRGKLTEVNNRVNGRLSELLELTRRHYYAKGRGETGETPWSERPDEADRRRELEDLYCQAPHQHNHHIHRIK